MKEYAYHISGTSFSLYPIETHFSLITLADGSNVPMTQQYPFLGPWGGCNVDEALIRDTIPTPTEITLVYLSIVERKFYALLLPINALEMDSFFERIEMLKIDSRPLNLIIGMTPYGGVAIWIGCSQKQLLLGWMSTGEIEVDMNEFLQEQPNITLEEYCLSHIKENIAVKDNLEKNGLPPRNLFDKYMLQFTYRYLTLFEQWDIDKEQWCLDSKSSPKDNQSSQTESNKQVIEPEFDYIEEALFDGTHDKLHDNGLMSYHQAGKPKKLAVKWHIKKSEYTAYFWFEDEEIRTIFDRFYGAHPDTKTDFMIRIDSDNKKFELALYRYGQKEPQVISESVYQLLVFKNNFEYYRSENYNQPKGAWIW